MTDVLIGAGLLAGACAGALLLLRWVLGQIVPDDEPDYTAEAQQGLIDPEEKP